MGDPKVSSWRVSKVAKQHLAGLGRNLRPGRLRMVAVAVLCGACGSGVPLALQDERTFFLNFSSGTITGQFNPAGFSNDEVEEVADWMCGRGRLDEFAAEPQETGLTEIEAQCLLSDITGFGRTEARRRGDNGSIDVTYRGTTQNGRLLRRQRI